MLIQCKHWKKAKIGVPIVREMLGVLTCEKADKVIITGTLPFQAVFREKNPEEIQSLSSEAAQRLLKITTRGDFTTPTCPKCRIKMTRRQTPMALG